MAIPDEAQQQRIMDALETLREAAGAKILVAVWADEGNQVHFGELPPVPTHGRDKYAMTRFCSDMIGRRTLELSNAETEVAEHLANGRKPS
jgi:hypothetical protein